MRSEAYEDQAVERAGRVAGAAEADVAGFVSLREPTSVSGAFTDGARADRLLAAGMHAGDRWLETDTLWEYHYTGSAWSFLGGLYVATAGQRATIIPTSADNGAVAFETDTLELWQVAAGAWVRRLKIQGTASQITAAILAGVLTLALPASPDVTTSYKVAGVKVVGAQGATVADPAGGATVDAEARTAIIALRDRLQAHGLIA